MLVTFYHKTWLVTICWISDVNNYLMLTRYRKTIYW